MSRSQRERAGRNRFSPRKAGWLGVSYGHFFACFGLGILLAVGVTFARQAWNRRNPTSPAGEGPRRPASLSRERTAEFSRVYRKANEALAAERYADALREFTRASQLAPADPRPHHALGKVYTKLILDERAEQAYRKAIEVDPEFLPAKLSLAVVLYESGKNREAMALLKEVDDRKPNDPFVWAELAINALRLGNASAAIRLLEKYNAVKGRQAWGYANLGRAYNAAGNFEAAERAYREALAIDPRMSNASLWLGQLLIARGRKAEADELLERFRRLRDLQTQEHNLKMALLRTPDDVRTLVEMARVRTLLGKKREALTALERALQVRPEDPRLKKLHEQVSRSLGGESEGHRPTPPLR